MKLTDLYAMYGQGVTPQAPDLTATQPWWQQWSHPSVQRPAPQPVAPDLIDPRPPHQVHAPVQRPSSLTNIYGRHHRR